MAMILSYVEPPEDVLAYMKEHCDVRLARPRKEKELFYNYLKEADGLYGAMLKIDDDLLDHAPHLKVVSNVSVGYDNFDMEAITNRGIMATHTPTVLIDAMADSMIGMMIATAKRMSELDRYVKEGHWKKPLTSDMFGMDVTGKTLGIIGMGRIGEEVARRASVGFRMNVLYHNRHRKPEAEKTTGAVYADRDELLETSDVVMVLTPLTESTRGMIGAEEFKQMKERAIFINGGRGPVVVEEDLVQALEKGQIQAAAVDVYDKEPVDSDHPLLKMDNVLTLPHSGTATVETRHAMYQDAAEQCVAGVLGQEPKHVIKR
ncbi:2-hydroxyacid dehydrogenase [Alteribacillus iranensis]|uniref:Glyoxylate/hydroxypyruvate reductase B n=1 Tax=Alteribacillus iranensis TaxID=930128 RepID=A0A1I2BM90_9BACI|nr:D-glycerate dehydrogenase [Alteribacillus iranensis]SFE57275.1 gluconate 2-dehydrogenase [Alteribacillus iranensis]